MAIDIDVVRGCQKELSSASDETSVLKRKLLFHQEEIGHAWSSHESKGILLALEGVSHRLDRVAKELEEISNLVMITGQEIMEEETAASASSPDVNERTET